jgi:dihydropteroate synthase
MVFNNISIMGIINMTPDSFSGDGLLKDKNFIQKTYEKIDTFVKNGAVILDIGGESTRPGAKTVSLEDELDRVLPVVKYVKKEYPSILISVDTTKSHVAKAVLDEGAMIINDVSGLMMQPEMTQVASQYGCYFVIMHSYQHHLVGHSEKVGRYQTLDPYQIIPDIIHDLEKLIIYAISHGIPRKNIIIDPGIGYGKTTEQNFIILRNLSQFKKMSYPILVGLSRKSFISHTEGCDPKDRLGGSVAANTIAMLNGANILRVHDVIETAQAVHVTKSILNAKC